MDPCHQDGSGDLFVRSAGDLACRRSLAWLGEPPHVERAGLCPDHLSALEALERGDRPEAAVGGHPPVGPRVYV